MLIVNLISPDGRYDQLYLSNYATICRSRTSWRGWRAWATCIIFGQRDYSMRVWLDPDKLAARNLTAGDVVAAIREQNVQVAAGADRPAAAPPGNVFQLRHDARWAGSPTPEQFGDIIVKTGADGADHAAARRGPDRAGRQRLQHRLHCSTASRRWRMAIFQLPGSNALETRRRRRAKMEELKKDFPDGLDYRDRLRHHALHPRVDPRGVQDAARGRAPGGASWCSCSCRTGAPSIIPLVAVPVALIGTFAVMAAAGLLPQQPLAVRPGAGDRHRGRRRDRGGRERRAPHRRRAWRRARRRTRRWTRSPAPVIAIGLVLSAVFVPTRVHQRHHRPVLPAVRPDDRRLDAHLGVQLADAQPGAGARCCCKPHHAPNATSLGRLHARLASAGSSSGSTGVFDAGRTGYGGAVGRLLRHVRHRAGGLRRAAVPDLVGLRQGAHRLHSRPGQGLPGLATCNCPTAPRSSGPRR